MSAWRREALEKLPSKRLAAERATSPMALWIELNLAAVRAFELRPRNDAELQAIFDYARYSLNGRDDDLRTAVVVAFFENVVQSKAAREDLHRWLSESEFSSLREAFKYHLSEDEFHGFEKAFRRERLEYGKRPAPKSGRAG
jgi:hypothetical protein